jgi:hypothetical protein
MATFPSKVNYATGDILTATNMNEIGQAINILDGAQTSAGKNTVLNSNFGLWQRGTTFTSAFSTATGTYTADRWLAYVGAGSSTISRQVTGDTTNLPFIQYCARVSRDSGQTSTNTVYFANGFESVNSIPLAGKTVVLSFYARAGANYSSASNALLANVITGTGTDQNVISGLTGGVNAISQTATLTTTWQRFTYSATLAATATQVAVRFDRNPVGTAGANDYYEITGVQLETANTASPYATNCPTRQAEVAACMRYYYRAGGSTAYQYFFNTAFLTTTTTRGVIPLPVPMRTAPTFGSSAANTFFILSSGNTSGDSGTVIGTDNLSNTSASVNFTVGTARTAGIAANVLAANNLNTYLEFIAEL